MKLFLNCEGRSMAMGNGTRERGMLLGTMTGAKLVDVLVAARSAVHLEDIEKAKFSLEDGVAPYEMLTALRNRLVATKEPEAISAAEPEPDLLDMEPEETAL